MQESAGGLWDRRSSKKFNNSSKFALGLVGEFGNHIQSRFFTPSSKSFYHYCLSQGHGTLKNRNDCLWRLICQWLPWTYWEFSWECIFKWYKTCWTFLSIVLACKYVMDFNYFFFSCMLSFTQPLPCSMPTFF